MADTAADRRIDESATVRADIEGVLDAFEAERSRDRTRFARAAAFLKRVVVGYVPRNRDLPLYALGHALRDHVTSLSPAWRRDERLAHLVAAGLTDGAVGLSLVNRMLLDFALTLDIKATEEEVAGGKAVAGSRDDERTVADLVARIEERDGVDALARLLASRFNAYRSAHLPYETRRRDFARIRAFLVERDGPRDRPVDGDPLRLWREDATPSHWVEYATVLRALAAFLDAGRGEARTSDVDVSDLSAGDDWLPDGIDFGALVARIETEGTRTAFAAMLERLRRCEPAERGHLARVFWHRLREVVPTVADGGADDEHAPTVPEALAAIRASALDIFFERHAEILESLGSVQAVAHTWPRSILLDAGLSTVQRLAARSERPAEVLARADTSLGTPRGVLNDIDDLRTRIAAALALSAAGQDVAGLPPRVRQARANLLRRGRVAALSPEEMAEELRSVRQALRGLDGMLARVEAAAAGVIASRPDLLEGDHESFIAKLRDLYRCKELAP